MAPSAVNQVFALAEMWEVLASHVPRADLAQLRLVCQKANQAAARFQFRHLLFKTSHNAYAPARLRSIKSLAHVRVLSIESPSHSLMNRKRLLTTMKRLAEDVRGPGAEPLVQAVDLSLLLPLLPQVDGLVAQHPWLRRRFRTLSVAGQPISDYSTWTSEDLSKWWTSLADLLDRPSSEESEEGVLALSTLAISPETYSRGLQWPHQFNNGPREHFFGVLGNVVAPHLETLSVSLGRTKLMPDDNVPKANPDTFTALIKLAFPKLRTLRLDLAHTSFSQFGERQDFDPILWTTPLLEELDISASMSYALRLRTFLPRLRSFKIVLSSEFDVNEHAVAVREEVIAFIHQHRAQLVSVSVDPARPQRRILYGPGVPRNDPSEEPPWDDIVLNPSEFPRLTGVAAGVKLSARARIAHGTLQGPDWAQSLAALEKETELDSLTVLSMSCSLTDRIEDGVKVITDTQDRHRQGQGDPQRSSEIPFGRVRELHISQTLPGDFPNLQQEQQTRIWKLLRALAPLSGVRRIEFKVFPYSAFEFMSARTELECEEAEVPDGLEIIREKDSVFRVLVSAGSPEMVIGESTSSSSASNLERTRTGTGRKRHRTKCRLELIPHEDWALAQG
ncbi:hypothetical protein V8E36_008360 [Tilletia maclaganii]